MILLYVLEPDDAVRMDDWCRPLQFTSMNGGHSDYYSFKSAYGGTPENNAKWARVGMVFGDVWEGEAVRELNKLEPYEFMRGDMPKPHRLTGFKMLPPMRS